MRPRWVFSVDVEDLVPMRHEPIGNNHAMAAEVHALGTHVGSARRVRNLKQFIGGTLELGRQSVVGVVAKAGVADS